MNKRIILPIILLIATLTCNSLFAQEPVTMYNMRTLPQSSRLNPAFQTNYNGHFGGLFSITPLFPSFDFSFHSNNLVYSDIIYKGSGAYSDSLVLAFNSQADALKLVDKLEKVNTFDIGLNQNLFNIGFKTKNIYWNIHAANKTSLSMSIPGGLVELLVKGNAHPDVQSADLSGLGVDFMNYMEYGIGASVEVTPELKVGARFKMLAGTVNVETVESDLYLNSYGDSIVLNPNLRYRTNQPAVIINDIYYDTEGDSMVLDTSFIETDQYLDYSGYDFSNPGFAFDFGAEYQVMPQLKVYASVTDLGYISWKSNASEFIVQDPFNFPGLAIAEIYNSADDNDSINFGEVLADSLLTALKPRGYSISGYKTWLPTKIYAGASYNLTDAIGFGALYRGIVYKGDLTSAISLSANLNTHHISAAVTYTIMENNMDNIGLGFAGRFGPFQTFIISDHVLEEFWPQNAKDVNIRLGFNWIFGYKTDKAALIE